MTKQNWRLWSKGDTTFKFFSGRTKTFYSGRETFGRWNVQARRESLGRMFRRLPPHPDHAAARTPSRSVRQLHYLHRPKVHFIDPSMCVCHVFHHTVTTMTSDHIVTIMFLDRVNATITYYTITAFGNTVDFITGLVALLTSSPWCGVNDTYGISVYSTKYIFPISLHKRVILRDLEM